MSLNKDCRHFIELNSTWLIFDLVREEVRVGAGSDDRRETWYNTF